MSEITREIKLLKAMSEIKVIPINKKLEKTDLDNRVTSEEGKVKHLPSRDDNIYIDRKRQKERFKLTWKKCIKNNLKNVFN